MTLRAETPHASKLVGLISGLAVASAACGEPAMEDAGMTDGGALDARIGLDVGPLRDGSPTDTGLDGNTLGLDASSDAMEIVDAEPEDAGPIDAGPIDECATGAHDCHSDGYCFDLADGFACFCRVGYAGDGRDCVDAGVSASAGTSVSIPNDTYDGTRGSMACMTLTVSSVAGFDLVDGDMEVEIRIDHSFVGDLVAKLFAPDGTVLTLFSRPGLTETADDGTECCGDSSNLSTAIRFADSDYTFSPPRFGGEGLGRTLADTGVVCRDDSECDFLPSAGATGTMSSFWGFHGRRADGDWAVCVGDAGTGGSGNLRSARLSFQRGAPLDRVVISEVMNDVGPDAGSFDDDGREWVELYNASASAVDLSGWVIASPEPPGLVDSPYQVVFTFPSGTSMPAGECWVVGGPMSDADNGRPSFEAALDVAFSPLLGNGGFNAQAVALFEDGSLVDLPIDAVIYGSANLPDLLNERGSSAIDVFEPAPGTTIIRDGPETWHVVGGGPTPGDCDELL